MKKLTIRWAWMGYIYIHTYTYIINDKWFIQICYNGFYNTVYNGQCQVDDT